MLDISDNLAHVKTVNDDTGIKRGDKAGEVVTRSPELLEEGDALQTGRVAATLGRDCREQCQYRRIYMENPTS